MTTPARKAMMKAWRRGMRRRQTLDPTSVSWWHLNVNSPGYALNTEAVNQMLARYGLLDKHVIRFIATPAGLDAFCVTGLNEDGQEILKRVHRPWKEK